MAEVIRIQARRDGFRRAGLSHPAVSVDHPAEAFSAEQIEALLAEPMLVVSIIGIEPAERNTEGPSTPAAGGSNAAGIRQKAHQGAAEQVEKTAAPSADDPGTTPKGKAKKAG